MNWLKKRLRRWLEIPASIERYYPPTRVLTAINYRDFGIIIFTEGGSIYRMAINDLTHEPILVKLMLELPHDR